MKVFINPGHSKNGKPDPGAKGFRQKEALLAAKIAESLSLKLNYQEIENVVYQQHEGTTANTQLKKVATVANDSGADLFISIHLNAANSIARGTETIYLGSSVNGKKFANLVNMELATPFDSYTFLNRGAKVDTRNLYVLKATSMPAVLTEIGFIDNEQDNKFIVNHIDEIAERLLNAILVYYNKPRKTFSNTIEVKEPQTSVTITYNPEPVKMEPLISLVKQSSGKYDCYVGTEKKLSENKLETCLEWIKKNYA